MHIPIKDYENLYTIHPSGEIRGIKNNNIKAVNPNKNTSYLQVNLHKQGKLKMCYLHRLLAQHFISNPDNLAEVNHIDGNRQNNNISNLEWVSRAGNIQHALKTGLSKLPPKKLTNKQYEDCLYQILYKRKCLTHLAKNLNIGLSKLSIHVKAVAIEKNILHQYLQALKNNKFLHRKGQNNGNNKRKSY